MADVYSGGAFSIERSGGDWTIWRYSTNTIGTLEPPEIERLILTTSGMDELRDYFTGYYPDDREEVAAMREP